MVGIKDCQHETAAGINAVRQSFAVAVMPVVGCHFNSALIIPGNIFISVFDNFADKEMAAVEYAQFFTQPDNPADEFDLLLVFLADGIPGYPG